MIDAWDQYAHLDTYEDGEPRDNHIDVFLREPLNEGDDMIFVSARDADPHSNRDVRNHILSRRPLVEMLRDAARTGYLANTSHGLRDPLARAR